MPIAEMATGASSGVLAGKLTNYGIGDTFVKEAGSKVAPG